MQISGQVCTAVPFLQHSHIGDQISWQSTAAVYTTMQTQYSRHYDITHYTTLSILLHYILFKAFVVIKSALNSSVDAEHTDLGVSVTSEQIVTVMRPSQAGAVRLLGIGTSIGIGL